MVKLEFIRETGDIYDKQNSWLNRSVKNPETNETLYYCKANPDGKLIIHRGGPDGPIFATGETCKNAEGSTEIFFNDSNTSIQIHHTHHKLPFTHCKTLFTYNNKQYHWKDHTELVDDASGHAVGKFHATWLEGSGHKIGTLEVQDAGMQDLAVVTAIAVQERSDETTMTGQKQWDRDLSMGIMDPMKGGLQLPF